MAQILVQYTFTGNTLAPSTTAAGISATSLSEVEFASVSTTTNPPGGSGNAARAITLEKIDDSFDTDHYYEFTLTPDAPGQALSLNNLTFIFNISSSGAGNSSGYQLRYDDLSDGAGFITIGTTELATNTTAVSANFDLSGAAFSNLTSGITFRIDVRDTGSNANNVSVRIDDVTVTGAVIPEPGTFGLGCLAAASVLFARRRKTASSDPIRAASSDNGVQV
jgi:hypothetical protein